MNEYFIGIDIGTGSCKAVAMDTTGSVIASAQCHYETLSSIYGMAEQDPEKIWDAFLKSLHDVHQKIGRLPVAVSLSSAMHSLLILDDKLQPVTKLITWADNRADDIAQELRNDEIAEVIYTQTGTPIHSMTPLCKIMWYRKYETGVYKKAHKFISIKDFIWYKIFGDFQADESLASATGLFNIHDRKWNTQSLELCGIGRHQLPEIVQVTFTRNDPAPDIRQITGFNGNVDWCIGASDGCLANLGSGAMQPHHAAITIGTSGAVRIASSQPLPDFSSMLFSYILDNKNFICGGPVNNGGNVMEWLCKIFYGEEDDINYDKIFRAISSIPPGANGLLFLPYLNGERAPLWDEKASGSFIGIKSFHTPAHFVKAGLEGICFNLKSILDIMEKQAGEIHQLKASGGFTKEKDWVQLLSDISGKTIVVNSVEDASAIGAVMLCMQHMNFSTQELLPGEENLHAVTPDHKKHKEYIYSYSIYNNLYSNLRKGMHSLYKDHL
jgi:gluconokinase